MPGQLGISNESKPDDRISQGDALRLLSRSPHPYHRRSEQIISSLGDVSGTSTPAVSSPLRSKHNTDDEETSAARGRNGSSPYAHSTDSDSGTEADDEHFLKGLPAPKLKAHKGLRNEDGSWSGTSSPLMSPDIVNEGERRLSGTHRQAVLTAQRAANEELRQVAEKVSKKRKVELRRRACEVVLLGIVGAVVFSGSTTRNAVWKWKIELSTEIFIITTLTILYPLRLMSYSTSGGRPMSVSSIRIPVSFEPAPLLYPPALPIFVAGLLAKANPSAMIVNTVLSISSLPSELVPSISAARFNVVHWLLSCLPFMYAQYAHSHNSSKLELTPTFVETEAEMLVYIYPLHQALCATLHYLTTTSLLVAELQLLSVALINVLMLSVSPQAVILKAVLWGGGVGTLISCTRVLSWVVALARVPKWRFKRAGSTSKDVPTFGSVQSRMFSPVNWAMNSLGLAGCESGDDSGDDDVVPELVQDKPTELKLDLRGLNGQIPRPENGSLSATGRPSMTGLPQSQTTDPGIHGLGARRRHTLPIVHPPPRSSKRTPSGRRKRASSSSTKAFFSLTESQANRRKWLYASYVYICVVAIILLGIRHYVGQYALDANEPIGWALGYLFGNLPQFRMYIISNNLERWVCLPARPTLHSEFCSAGWVEHLRQTTFGPANTRLLLLAYWSGVITFGLLVVFKLSAIYEVDTRRKVFHFMMVAMLLPATFIDPTYAALALSLVLAVFLLLDLFRASQLPPLSKPLAYFLTPYVDGRDLRGPVVISHIFLLIGCAIPLWLSLGALARTGLAPVAGWEVPVRDVSMVAGVVCVGMGDAAASLIGRRYGRHKWFWSGGKSIEGSVAFAAAVAVALLAAKVWLVVGGWPDGGSPFGAVTLGKIALASSLASLTEAVLTGGNDNVVCPVVLWLCVKGLRI